MAVKQTHFGRADLDVELVAGGVGDDHPAPAVRLAPVVDDGRAEGGNPLDLLVTRLVRLQVEVHPVLQRLPLGGKW
jgi:hypothetical protein